jgi:hypothetical protein
MFAWLAVDIAASEENNAALHGKASRKMTTPTTGWFVVFCAALRYHAHLFL